MFKDLRNKLVEIHPKLTAVIFSLQNADCKKMFQNIFGSNFFCFGPLKFGKVFENVMMPQLRFSLDRVEEVIFVVEMRHDDDDHSRSRSRTFI